MDNTCSKDTTTATINLNPYTYTTNSYTATINPNAFSFTTATSSNGTDFSIPLDKFCMNKTDSYTFSIHDRNEFKSIKEHSPNKVYTFTFQDGTKIKTVCSEEDTFDLEYAFYLALAKKIYSKEYTFEGVLYKVKELQSQKYYVKLVKNGMKLFYNMKEEEAKKELEEKRIKERKQKKIAKKKAKKEREKLKESSELYRVIKKAIEMGTKKEGA